VKAVSEIMQEYTQSGGVRFLKSFLKLDKRELSLFFHYKYLQNICRPFGVSLLVSGGDADGSHLYQVDPSGTYFEWKASAIGFYFYFFLFYLFVFIL